MSQTLHCPTIRTDSTRTRVKHWPHDRGRRGGTVCTMGHGAPVTCSGDLWLHLRRLKVVDRAGFAVKLANGELPAQCAYAYAYAYAYGHTCDGRDGLEDTCTMCLCLPVRPCPYLRPKGERRRWHVYACAYLHRYLCP